MKQLLYLWQLPQNLLGLLLVWLYKAEEFKEINGTKLYVADKMRGAISLGRYIILSEYSATREISQQHEYGHARQSMYLGWLYLIVIGIPSLTNAAFGFTNNYYDFYTERWADHLGGIKRDQYNKRVL